MLIFSILCLFICRTENILTGPQISNQPITWKNWNNWNYFLLSKATWKRSVVHICTSDTSVSVISRMSTKIKVWSSASSRSVWEVGQSCAEQPKCWYYQLRLVKNLWWMNLWHHKLSSSEGKRVWAGICTVDLIKWTVSVLLAFSLKLYSSGCGYSICIVCQHSQRHFRSCQTSSLFCGKESRNSIIWQLNTQDYYLLPCWEDCVYICSLKVW